MKDNLKLVIIIDIGILLVRYIPSLLKYSGNFSNILDRDSIDGMFKPNLSCLLTLIVPKSLACHFNPFRVIKRIESRHKALQFPRDDNGVIRINQINFILLKRVVLIDSICSLYLI